MGSLLDQGVLTDTQVSGGAHYVGEMQMDATITQGKVPACTTVDLSLGHELGEIEPSLDVSAINLFATNAFDEEN
ncbi:hypothetical protein CS022_06490 [Veronia nyctiphanis]|uniref:Uncharacterized protein n=1 Tax=Veronia nyctiphanis TaxID=1278244 RepID=A0A4Q0YXK0_9GAMM|nr:hypothetical protein [Veronia nyctiphanis]RXJ73929.1 hypothetical protein CS022_06490 [Veronia nyctiphanis]